MAGNDFRIDIKANDQATSVFRRVSASVAKAMQPVAKVQKTISTLGDGKQLEKRSRELDSVARSLAGIAKVGESAGLRIPLLGGLGGGFAIGAGVTAFAEMMRESSAQATRVMRFTQQHAMTAREVQRLTAAAGREGIDEESAQKTIGAFSSRMEDIAYGRDPDGRMMLARAGVTLRKDANGAPQAHQAFLDIADAIKRQANPEAASALARQFGLEELLPLLQDGSTAIRKFGDEAEKTGQVMSTKGIAGLTAYGRALDTLSGSIKGVRNGLAETTASTVAPGINTLAGGINRAGENSKQRSFLDTMLLPLRTLLGGFEIGQSMGAGEQQATPGRRRVTGIVQEPGGAVRQFADGMRRINTDAGDYRPGSPAEQERGTEALRVIQSELAKETNPETRAALTREIARLQAQMNAPGSSDADQTAAAAGPSGGSGAGAPQSVKVEIAVTDDRVRVKTTQGGGGQAPMSRVAYAMPTSGIR